MARWRKRVDINRHLDDEDDTPLAVRAERIEQEIKNSGVERLDPFGQLGAFVEELKEQARTGDPDYFDIPLGKIYDWCDYHRVWTGG